MQVRKILNNNSFKNSKNQNIFSRRSLDSIKMRFTHNLPTAKTHDKLEKTTIDSIEILNKNPEMVEKIANSKFIAKLSDFVDRFFL